jgi:hypothetical protein
MNSTNELSYLKKMINISKNNPRYTNINKPLILRNKKKNNESNEKRSNHITNKFIKIRNIQEITIANKIKLSNIPVVSYLNFYESNIKKCLSYLNTIGKLIGNIYIVCHGNIMRNFLYRILGIKELNERLHEIIGEYNLWTFNLKNKTSNIYITRHSLTVGNLLVFKKNKITSKIIYENNKKTIKENLRSPNNKIEENILFKKIGTTDTNLTIYGIITTLLHSNNMKNNILKVPLNDFNNIYVSILVRTWITAICLYLPIYEGTNMKLIVLPFLRENGLSTSIQSEPNELNYKNNPISGQIKSVKSFFDFLLRINKANETSITSSEANSNQTASGDYNSNSNNKIIYKSILNIIEYFKKGYELSIIRPMLKKDRSLGYSKITIFLDGENFSVRKEDDIKMNNSNNNLFNFNINEFKIFNGVPPPKKNKYDLINNQKEVLFNIEKYLKKIK